MKIKRDKRVEVNPDAKLSGILYTTRRPTISEKELHLKGEKKNKKSVKLWLSTLFVGLKEKLGRTQKLPKHAYQAPKKTGIRKISFRDFFDKGSKPFYVGVTACSLLLIGLTVVFTSGAFEPASYEVSVNDAGRIVYAQTREKTVGEFLEKNGIVLEEGDVLEASLTDPIENGQEIVIRRAMPLTIIDGEEEIQVKMLAGTVSQAIDQAGITLGEADEVYPVAESYITKGMTITIIHVEVKQIVEEEVLHYKEVTKSDNTLAKGKTKVKTQGENGLQKNTIEVTYKNGVEVSRKTVSEEVVKKPVDKVTLVGTYVAPAKKPSGGSSSKPSTGGNSNSGGSSSKPDYSTDDSGKLTKVPSTSEIHSAGSLYEHKKAPAPASSIIKKTMVMNSITAYTHTGNRTATGVWPKMGTIAADPKQIPYGTKIYVPGYGYGRIEDTGSNRHDADYYCIDLFMETKSECTTWGRKRNWKIYILG